MMMASIEETSVPELYRCYHCGYESANNTFKYCDNKKTDQPRYKCGHCGKHFTLGYHGRPQGKTYTKKRNEDPSELKSLSRQCCHCGVSDNAVFKYYNNHNLLQPRFKCLSCGKQFQMRVLGTGEERRLVHTLSHARAPRCQKQGLHHAALSSSNNNKIYQPFDGSFLPARPSDPLIDQTGTKLLQEMSDEDAQFVDLLEDALAEPEVNPEADPQSFETANGGNGNWLPLPDEDEDAQFVDLLEDALAEPEVNLEADPQSFETANADPFIETGNRLLQEMSNEDEDAQFVDLLEAALAEPEVNPEADPQSFETANGGDGNLFPLPLCDDDTGFLQFLETELLTDENDKALGNVVSTVSSTTATVDSETLPPTWSASEDSELMILEEAGAMAPVVDDVSDYLDDMVFESDFNSAEVMYGTSVVDKPASPASGSCNQTSTSIMDQEPSITDPSCMSYAEAAVAVCHQMDMENARKNSVQSIGSNSPDPSSAGSTMVEFGDAFCVIPETHLLQQALPEGARCADFHWNEDDEVQFDTEMSPCNWVY